MIFFPFFFLLDTSEGNVLYLFSYIDFEAVFNTLRRKYIPFTLFWKGCVFSSRTNQKCCLGIQRLDFKYYEFFRFKVKAIGIILICMCDVILSDHRKDFSQILSNDSLLFAALD